MKFIALRSFRAVPAMFASEGMTSLGFFDVIEQLHPKHIHKGALLELTAGRSQLVKDLPRDRQELIFQLQAAECIAPATDDLVKQIGEEIEAEERNTAVTPSTRPAKARPG